MDSRNIKLQTSTKKITKTYSSLTSIILHHFYLPFSQISSSRRLAIKNQIVRIVKYIKRKKRTNTNKIANCEKKEFQQSAFSPTSLRISISPKHASQPNASRTWRGNVIGRLPNSRDTPEQQPREHGRDLPCYARGTREFPSLAGHSAVTRESRPPNGRTRDGGGRGRRWDWNCKYPSTHVPLRSIHLSTTILSSTSPPLHAPRYRCIRSNFVKKRKFRGNVKFGWHRFVQLLDERNNKIEVKWNIVERIWNIDISWRFFCFCY